MVCMFSPFILTICCTVPTSFIIHNTEKSSDIPVSIPINDLSVLLYMFHCGSIATLSTPVNTSVPASENSASYSCLNTASGNDNLASSIRLEFI